MQRLVPGFCWLIALALLSLSSPVRAEPIPENKFAGTKAGELRTIGGIQFCWCPAGKFTMGSPASEKDRDDDENQVPVTLTRGFYLGQHEVTQALWKKVMDTTPWKGKDCVKEGSSYPATYVGWENASEFCAKLTAKGHSEGWLPRDWKIDLPTEAQWEYACRAETEGRFSFGDDESKLSDYAWWGSVFGDGNAISEEYAHQVGLKKANPWGLHDIHGNVSEWCRDGYVDKLPGGTDPDVQERSTRMLRGGSWFSFGRFCRSADRFRAAPEYLDSNVGFRLAAVPTR